MPLSPREMEAAVIKNLPVRTGKTLEEWVDFVKQNAPADKSARLAWLKTEHKLGHVQASIILGRVDTGKSDYADAPALVDAMFSGENAALRPLWEYVGRQVLKLFPGVKMTANRSYIAFSRHRQFMVMRPYKAALLVGLALPKDTEHERLVPAKRLGAGDRIAFYLPIRAESDWDRDAVKLVQQAWEGN